MSKTRVTKGPASEYEGRGESIYEFSDGKSGGLIAFQRDDAGRLIVDLYRMDADVLVRAPGSGAHDWVEAPSMKES